jgi:hypothetical protein
MTTPICPVCRDTGTVTTTEFDGRTARPCPSCQPNPERDRLAREFGTDRQRAELRRRSRAIPMRTPR